MRSVWVFLLWVLLPNPALAATIKAQVDENLEFSRVSLVFPTPLQWKFGKTEFGFEFSLISAKDKIDVTDIYATLSRHRIQDLTVSNNGARLIINATCECEGEAFEYRPGFVTIKISDQMALKNGEPQQTTAAEIEHASGVEPSLLPVFGGKPQASIPRVGTFSTTQISNTRSLPDPKVEMPSTRISEIRGQVLRQLSMAASQGLLDASQTEISPPVSEVESTKESEITPIETQAQDPDPFVENANVFSATGFDRANNSVTQDQNLTDRGAKCIPDIAVDLPSWGNPKSVLNRIQVERASFTREFDRVDPDAFTRFIKATIYAGFGAEAISALSAFNISSKNPEILSKIANIMDGEQSSENTIFNEQIGCEGKVALWAALSLESLKRAAFINRKSVIKSFAELPQHLRKHLGPQLAQKFMAIDDVETARTLQNAFSRASGESTAEMKLLEANLDAQRGLTTDTTALLSEVIKEDGEFSIFALMTVLKTEISKNKPVDLELILTAQSMAFEQKETEQGVQLQALIALAQGTNGLFSRAIKTLKALEKSVGFSKPQSENIWSQLLRIAVETANTPEFVQFVYAEKETILSLPATRKIKNLAAERLLKDGFPDLANEILSASDNPNTIELNLLAQAALARNDAAKALEVSRALPQDRARQIRRQAYIMLGDIEKAAKESDLLTEKSEFEAALWIKGNWDEVGKFGAGIEKSAVGFMYPSPQESEPLGLVAESQFQLVKTQEAREAIAALMKKYKPVSELNF